MFDGNLNYFSEQVLDSYSTRIAQDNADALFYMTVGSSRLKLISDITHSYKDALKIGKNSNTKGAAYFEAVLGEFGSGKSHIGYILKQNALSVRSELLVAHCQITGEIGFQNIIASILKSLHISGISSTEQYGLELSSYMKLAEWAGGNQFHLENFIIENIGNLPKSLAKDLAIAIRAIAAVKPDASFMQRFIHAWVERSEPKMALEVFEQIIKLFNKLNLNKIIIILDEFEALSSLTREKQLETVQYLQDLHDDFAGRVKDLPSLYLLFFSTEKWWQTAQSLLPSLFGEGDRTRKVSAIPNITKLEIFALLERYITLFLFSERIKTDIEINFETFSEAVDDCWKKLAGKTHHMRTIHDVVRSKVLILLDI